MQFSFIGKLIAFRLRGLFCFMCRKVNLLGKKFNRLTVLSELPQRAKNGGYIYKCQCDCGNEVNIRSDSINSGKTKSCGCYNSEEVTKRATKHGQNKRGIVTPEYNSWHGMIQRCTNSNSASFAGYGARGVTVCPRWLKFENFFEDMGEKPSPLHSLDRFPNNETGNYEPSNCRWGTDEEQSRNKRTNRWLVFGSKKMIISDWAKELKTTSNAIDMMMKRGKSFIDVYNFYKNKNQ